GIAIAAIMFDRVEEFIAAPGSPNLFWSLTDLPSPFIDIRRAMRVELNTIHRSFPQLRELDRELGKKTLTANEVEKLIEDFFTAWGKVGGENVPAWQGKAAMAAGGVKG